VNRAVGWAVLACLLVLATAAGVPAWRYGLWDDGEPGPGLFPLIACGLIAMAGVAVAVELLAPPTAAAMAQAEAESTPTPVRLAATMGIVLAWPFLLQPLGYAVASGLALVALLLSGGVGALASLAIAGAAVGGSHLLFVTLLEVPLPAAWWL